MLNRWLPALVEMAAAAIFSALFHALMRRSRLTDRTALQMTGCCFALAHVMQEHTSGSDYHIVYVVIMAKLKWIIDQLSWSYVLHSCQTTGSVNCFPIGHAGSVTAWQKHWLAVVPHDREGLQQLCRIRLVRVTIQYLQAIIHITAHTMCGKILFSMKFDSKQHQFLYKRYIITNQIAE